MKRTQAQQTQAQVDMTPMLDIVFIMLIFFIVTATFANETGLEVTKPKPNQQSTEPSKSLPIYVAENGTVTMQSRIIDMARVQANMQTYMAENNTDSISVLAHPKAKHLWTVQVINQAKKAGINKVAVLVNKR